MKIKSYISFIFTAAILCSTVSCSLDKEPSTSADMQLETIGDFENQTRACYTGFRSSGYYGGIMLLLPDVMSDNLIITNTGLQGYRDIFNFNILPTSGAVSSIWGTAYNTILQANRVIEALGTTNKFVGTTDELRSYGLLAEAYTSRAMAHFDMVRLYAPRYANATSAASIPAIPYVTSTDPKLLPSRNTLGEVYQYILSDLDKAYALMGQTNDTHNATINTRFKQQSIAAVLSRVYLTMAADGNDAVILKKAQDYAFEAIVENNYGSDILDQTAFYQIWHSGIAQSNPEVLLRIGILDTDGQSVGNGYSQPGSDGFRNDYAINHSLYLDYTTNGTDVRVNAYTKKDTYKGNTYAGVYKYRTRGGSSPVNTCDAVLIRTPEMYLTIAEAFARVGGYDANAVLFLNLVRNKRYTTVTDPSPTGAAILTAIMDERCKELAFEGQRFFDLKRLNSMIERGTSGDLIDGSGNPATVRSISASDPRTIWPIPQSEIDRNPNLKN